MLSQLLSGLLVTTAAQTDGSIEQAVVWKWQPKSFCSLRQHLDKAGSFLQLSRMPGDDATAVTLLDRGQEARSWSRFKGAIVALKPSGSTLADGFLNAGELPRSRTITVNVTDQNFLNKFSVATDIMISHGEFGVLKASPRFAAAAVQALRDCEKAKMNEWGIDPIAWRALQSRPVPVVQPVEWFSTGDYPRVASIYGIGGEVVIRVDVAPDGLVRDCALLNRQAMKEFKSATCAVLKRNGRFHPAIDANGQPVSAPFVIRVRFDAS